MSDPVNDSETERVRVKNAVSLRGEEMYLQVTPPIFQINLWRFSFGISNFLCKRERGPTVNATIN